MSQSTGCITSTMRARDRTMPGYPFSEIKDRLDDWRLFNNMVESPYYHDAVYERFSDAEYERRYSALRAKMRERGLDCVIVRRTEPLEFRRRDALALRPLGMARHGQLCRFSPRGRADVDLLDGRHPHRGDSERECHQRCAPVAQRTLCRGDNRADQ